MLSVITTQRSPAVVLRDEVKDFEDLLVPRGIRMMEWIKKNLMVAEDWNESSESVE
jgi:hypothetical protein